MVLFSYPHIQTNFFSLIIFQQTEKTYFKMCMLSPTVNTAVIPQTHEILSQVLPNIHISKCFNDNDLSFSQEVKRTEIGHLFEHILLEYIYELKVAKGNAHVVVKGETSWNWKRDPHGTFHIIINIGVKDASILPFALKKSIALLEKILSHDPLYKTLSPQDYTSQYYKQMASYVPSAAME